MSDDYHFIREPGPTPLPDLPEALISLATDDEGSITIDPRTGALQVEQPDGSVVINLDGNMPTKDKRGAAKHDANLAEYVDDGELGTIAEELLIGIESDLQSRSEWVDTIAQGEGLLAFKIEKPKAGTVDGSAPLDGMSTVRSSLLKEAVLRFQANATAELLPAAGPCKVRNDEAPQTKLQQNLMGGTAVGQAVSDESDTLAEVLEKAFNHYFTTIDKEYYPDTRRMLFKTGFCGSGFKKVYRDPLKRRPVSRAVDATDVIVSDAEVSLSEAARVTHRIKMRPSVLKKMQRAKLYRDIEVAPPSPQPDEDAAEQKERDVTGINPTPQLPSDYKHTIYECYCELDLPGFEEDDGIALPYRVSIDKDSRTVLEVRRNWKEGDDRYIAHMPLVRYPFIEGLGFYGQGLLHVLGNDCVALTAAIRMILDSGMFASFPGFLYTDAVARQETNLFRVPAGGGLKINTGGMPIGNAVMALPYKDASGGLMNITTHIEQLAQRVGGTMDLQVGEGRQDAPVGTTMAMMDQATKLIAAVHKGLLEAQSAEFQLLRELFVEDPDALLCGKAVQGHHREDLIAALENCNLVPAADPNTPSHTIRLMRASGLIMLAQGNPTMFNLKEVYERALKIIGIPDIDGLWAPPQPPSAAPNPEQIKAEAAMVNAQAAAKRVDVAAATAMQDAQQKAASLASEERIANLNLTKEVIIHQNDRADADRQRMLELHQHGLERDRHALAVGEAVHGATMDLRKHALDAATAAHGANMDVIDAMQPQNGGPAQ